jgi:hypothetical protein
VRGNPLSPWLLQTFALDLGVFVEEIVRQRGILPRGLAHPAIFQVAPLSCTHYLLPELAS